MAQIRQFILARYTAARARGRKGGRKFKMTPIKLQIAQVAMEKSETKISDLCKELGITRQTLYRHLDPKGELRSSAHKLMAQKNN